MQEKWGWIGIIWEKRKSQTEKQHHLLGSFCHISSYLLQKNSANKERFACARKWNCFPVDEQKKNIVHVQVSDRGDRCSMTALPIYFTLRLKKFFQLQKKEHRIVRTTQSMRRRKVDRGDRWLIKVPPDITTGRISKEEEHLFLEKWRKNMSAAPRPILQLVIETFFKLCNVFVKIWCKKQRNIGFSCLILVRRGPRPWP